MMSQKPSFHHNAQSLAFPDIFSSEIRQASAGLIGAAEHIALIPAEGRDTQSQLSQLLQPRGIVADACGAFQRQNRGHFPIFRIAADLFRGLCLSNQITVFRDLPLQVCKHRIEHLGDRMTEFLVKAGVCKHGEALGIAAEALSPLQINMSIVAAQHTLGLQILSHQRQCCVAVQIKYIPVH